MCHHFGTSWWDGQDLPKPWKITVFSLFFQVLSRSDHFCHFWENRCRQKCKHVKSKHVISATFTLNVFRVKCALFAHFWHACFGTLGVLLVHPFFDPFLDPLERVPKWTFPLVTYGWALISNPWFQRPKYVTFEHPERHEMWPTFCHLFSCFSVLKREIVTLCFH